MELDSKLPESCNFNLLKGTEKEYFHACSDSEAMVLQKDIYIYVEHYRGDFQVTFLIRKQLGA